MKKLRYLFILIAGLFFYTMVVAALVRNIYLNEGQQDKLKFIKGPLQFMAEFPATVKKSFDKPGFLVENSSGNSDYIRKKNGDTSESLPLLLRAYKTAPFHQEFELLDLQSGRSLKVWKPDNEEIYQKANNDDNPRNPLEGSDLYMMHPLMLRDSSLVFNVQLGSLLARLNPDNSLAWANNDRTYHHSIELDHEGMIWSCTRPFKSMEYDIMPTDNDKYRDVLLDDAITKIHPEDGRILYNKPVIEILLENGYEELLLRKGQVISDPVHLNDIQPALEDGEFWNKGDLLISCRNISTVFLYRPKTNKILWLKEGPWHNQHDGDFLSNGKISVFGNDIFREESTIDPKLIGKNLFFIKKRPHNEIYIYNFHTDSITNPYTNLLRKEAISTKTSGRSELLENGNVFVEDTNHGRIIVGDSVKSKLELVKRIDKDHISSLFWSRIIKN